MVMPERYGLTTSGDSICPTNIFDAAASDSDPDVFMLFAMIFAISSTTLCKIP
jgi:hypothetical protein